MEAKISHLDILLDQLSAKTKQPLDPRGFEEMSETIGNISSKYLYENLYRKKENAKKKKIETINVQPSKLDRIAQFIGFNNYRVFTEALDKPISKILIELTGNYYSYVRRNDDQGVILRSPVKIVENDGEIWMELKGGRWDFEGRVELENGCLFVLLKSSGGKMIHHVYKIGRREKPKLLQGIFSGVSTAFDPIGGRVVLIRMDEAYDELEKKELKISDLKKSKSADSKSLAKFFATYQDNNLRIGKVTTFSIDDLK